jgi:hypothetical protein
VLVLAAGCGGGSKAATPVVTPGVSKPATTAAPSGTTVTAAQADAATPAAQATPVPATYVVKAGDTLGAICSARLPAVPLPTCVEGIVEQNRLAGADQLSAGQTLSLPGGASNAAGAATGATPVASASTGSAATAAPAAVAQATTAPAAAATSTPKAQPLATATVAIALPTATFGPAATPTAAPTRDAYLEAITPPLQSYPTLLNQLADLIASPDLESDAWNASVSATTQGLRDAGTQIRAASPPACLQAPHAQLVSAIGEFDQVANEVDTATSTLETDSLSSVPGQMDDGTDRVNAAAAAIGAAPC